MTWSHFALAYVLGAVFLLGPGYLFLSAVRLPAWHRVLLAPLVSAAWVAGLGIVFAWVGLRYDGWTVIAATVVVAAAVGAVVRLTPAGGWLMSDRDTAAARTSPAVWLALAGTLVVSAAIWCVQFLRSLSGPAAITRAYDTPWHASIIKMFLTTGDGSTLTAAGVDHTVGSTFYPAAWHDMVALTAGLGHAPVFGGINAVVMGELTLVWPLSMIAFVTALFGRRAVPVVATGIVGCLFAAFPLTFLSWGIIYSNLYGYALLPALSALCVWLFADRLPDGLGRRIVAIAFVVGFVGDAIAQPNAVFTLAVLMLPMILGVLYRWLAPRSRWVALGACVALVVVGAAAWVGVAHTPMMHRTTTLDRPTAGSLGKAVTSALFQGYGKGRDQWALALAVLLGVVLLLALRRCRQWLVASYVLISLCYVVSASQQVETHLHWLRMNLTGYWYNDYNRLAGATIMIAVPLAVVAIDIVVEYAERRLPQAVAVATAAVVALALAAGVLTSSQFHQHRSELREMAARNSELYGGRVAFLRRVSRTVPAGQAVANNPFDGSVYGWSLFGLDVFFKSYSQNWIGDMSPAMVQVANHLDQAARDPRVCAALRQYHVTYALKMSTRGRLITTVWHGTRIWTGQHLTAHTPGFKPVMHGPGATLYKITACGLAG